MQEKKSVFIQQIMSDVVSQFMHKTGCTRDYSNDLFIEMNKFLWICGNYPGTFSPSKMVDEMWHLRILYDVESYTQWCTAQFGKIINHQCKENKILTNDYDQTLLLLQKEFGELNHTIWEPIYVPSCNDGTGGS